MSRVLALLDKPNRASFGMTSIVIEDEEGIRVLGLAQASAHRGRSLTKVEVEELARGGHLLATDGVVGADKMPPDTVALWIGGGFIERAEDIGLLPAPRPAKPKEAPGGVFFLGPAPSMYPYLERWTVKAFQQFRNEPDPKSRKSIASLMRWVLPNHPESLAAAWRVSADSDSELDKQIRTYAHGLNKEALRARHERILHAPDDRLTELRLAIFVGGTGVGREQLAIRFAEQFNLEFVSFRAVIPDEPKYEPMGFTPTDLKIPLMKKGQAQVDTSPLGFALAALAQSARHTVVVDSVRHRKIRETLHWLKPKRLCLVAVTANEQKRRADLEARRLPNSILDDPTELEIPDLIKDAEYKIDAATVSNSDMDRIYESLQD